MKLSGRGWLPAALGIAVTLLVSASPVRANAPAVAALNIDAEGPGWTRPDALRPAFDTQVGTPFDAGVLWRDLDRIRNYQIFQHVTATTRLTPEGVIVDVAIVDRWSIIPVFQPSRGGGVLHILLGLRDANFLGLAQDVTLFGGIYQRTFSYTDGSQQKRTRFVGGGIWRHRQVAGRHQISIIAQRAVGSEFFFYGKNTAATQYETEVNSGNAQFLFRRYDWIQPGVNLNVVNRRYDLLTRVALPQGSPSITNGIRPAVLLKIGQVNYDAFLYNGLDFVGQVFHEFRPQGPPGFWGSSLQTRGFLRPTGRLNLAARGMALMRNNSHAADDVALGGFTHVRGFPSQFFRGHYGLVLNTEARVTLFNRLFNSFFVQAVAFYDAAAAGSATLFSELPQRGHAMGGGLRGSVHQLVGVFGRLDAARSLSHPELGWDVGFSVGQFF